MREDYFDRPVYENAPTTHRTADNIAHRHGFRDVNDVVDALPEGGWMLDIGAGASPFGRAVAIAGQRKDITVVQLDFSYRDPAILEEISKDAPKNLRFITGDATKLAETFEEEMFDLTVSNSLFLHFSLENDGPAKAAARGVFAVTKPGGFMAIGPKTSTSPLSLFKPSRSLRITKEPGVYAEDVADLLATATKLPPRERWVQKIVNNAATPYFGTSRYVKTDRAIEVYDPESGVYVPALSKRAVHVAIGLGAAVAKYISQQEKGEKLPPRTRKDMAVLGSLAAAAATGWYAHRKMRR